MKIVESYWVSDLYCSIFYMNDFWPMSIQNNSLSSARHHHIIHITFIMLTPHFVPSYNIPCILFWLRFAFNKLFKRLKTAQTSRRLSAWNIWVDNILPCSIPSTNDLVKYVKYVKYVKNITHKLSLKSWKWKNKTLFR